MVVLRRGCELVLREGRVKGVSHALRFAVSVLAWVTLSAGAIGATVPAQPRLAGKRVVVLDKHQQSGAALAQQLRAWGMAVQMAPQVAELFRVITTAPPIDLIIVDAQLPPSTLETLIGLAQPGGAAGATPLILLTNLDRVTAPTQRFASVPALRRPVKPRLLYELVLALLTDTPVPQRVSALTSGSQPINQQLGQTHPLRILITEDTPTNRVVLGLMLERMGYQADEAITGYEALAALEQRDYDVILMDMYMPDLDGLETTRQIRRRWTHGPQIVAVTANATPEDRERCLAAGMDDYLSKPVRIEALQAALERCATRRDPAARVAPTSPPRAAVEQADSGLDPAIFGALQALGDLAPIIQLVIEEIPLVLTMLETALDGHDGRGVQDAAHRLRGSCGYIGAVRLETGCAELEGHGQAGRLGEATALYPLVAHEARRLIQILTSIQGAE